MPPVLSSKAATPSDLGAGYLGLGQGQGTGCLLEDRLFDSIGSTAAVKPLSASAWGLALHRVGAAHPIAHLDSRRDLGQSSSLMWTQHFAVYEIFLQ